MKAPDRRELDEKLDSLHEWLWRGQKSIAACARELKAIRKRLEAKDE